MLYNQCEHCLRKRQVSHKKIAEDEVTDFVEEDSNTETFDENSTMTLKNHMQLIENRPPHCTLFEYLKLLKLRNFVIEGVALRRLQATPPLQTSLIKSR